MGNPRCEYDHDAPIYTVIVGNIGEVYYGKAYDAARRTMLTYIGQSKTAGTRAEEEPVTLFKDGEIITEYDPTNPKDRERRY